MNRKVKIILIVIAVLLIAYAVFYMTQYYPAQNEATVLLNGSENVSIVEIDNGLLLDGKGNETSIIFYPGAKVEYTSYLPMFMELANQGIDCYILEVPFNMALLGENEADSVIDSENYTHYLLAGHSLGGAVASSYLNHTGKGDGVILLAGYPKEKITKPVLSIYGSNDGVLNRESYNESKSLMSNLTEFVIEGGNHAQFAYYGHQNGDNDAEISAESQQNHTVEKILEFISDLNF